jgi:membrane-associated protease RseP (regulator of RpoE activity)
MLRHCFRHWTALGLAAIAPLVARAQENLPQPQPAIADLRLAVEDNPQDLYAFIADENSPGEEAVEVAPIGEYWIGIALGELPPVAKKQLQLEHGLVVEDVLPDSPAAKAEFKPHDVLIRAGEAVLDQPADILKAVDEAKDKEMRVIILRDGKEMAVQVTPMKRPQPEVRETQTLEARIPGGAIERIEEALRELKGQGGQNPLELYFARPGVVVSHTQKGAGVPNNFTVRVNKEGDKPAKIYVKRDDKEWEVTEDKLGDLPDDVRPVIERMLGRGPLTMKLPQALPPAVAPPATARADVRYRAVPLAPATPVAPATPAPQTARLHAYRVESRGGVEAKIDQILKKLDALDSRSIDELKKEVERLRKEVDELRGK